MSSLERKDHEGVVLNEAHVGAVHLAFTERTGGVSEPPFTSLNLGAHVGDDPDAVAENRRRVLEALGCGACAERLLVPNQVHGDHTAVVRSADEAELARVREEIAAGADGIVCCVPGVPVLLNFADCVPVVLACEGGFAVVHSGWKGTIAAIAGKAARMLSDATGCAPEHIFAFIGPHITGAEYEVSEELIERFAARFPQAVHAGPSRLLDLAACIRAALAEAGVPEDNVCDPGLSTVGNNDRFFSYRAEKGTCGRHGALAVMGEA